MPAYDYKDPMNREFVSLNRLSDLLSRTKRQLFRHLGKKSLFSIKYDNKRYILKDDILREYPQIAERLTDTVGESTTPTTTPVDVYGQSQQHEDLTRKLDHLGQIATQFQTHINSIQSIESTQKATSKTMAQIQKSIGSQSKRGVWLFSTLGVLMAAAVSTAVVYGVIQFKDLNQDLQTKHESQISQRNDQLHDLSMQYTALLSQHTKTTSRYQESIDALRQEIEQLRTENSQYSWLGETVKFSSSTP